MAQQPDLRPIVFHPIELASFVQYALHRIHGEVHLIVCSSQEEFLRQLLASIHHEKDITIQEAEASGLTSKKLARLAKRKHDLLIPTLRQIASASNIKVTFCATLSQLQACLSVFSFAHDATTQADTTRTIALINPIALHRRISSFSAQGISRTIAGAVEAAARSKARLLIVECPSRAPPLSSDLPPDSDDTAMRDTSDSDEQMDIWDEEISILNVTTKSFGPEKGWVGRTVRLRDVVGRWCVFKSLD